MNILVVDDTGDARIILATLLEQNGHKVVTAENGKIALEMMNKSLPDIVITDILMPEVDGFELCRKIKKHNDWKNILIIIYTGTYVTPVNEQLGRALGAAEYIIKPQEPDELFKLIQKTIEKHKI